MYFSNFERVNKIKKEKERTVVTLVQAKNQLNIIEDFHDDDNHILFLIDSAANLAENYIGADINLTYNTLEYINFAGASLVIKEVPFKNIESIKYYVDDVEYTVDDYDVWTREIQFIVDLKKAIMADKLVINFYTGYDYDEAPPAIVNAILVKINDLYDIERTSYTSGLNYRDNKTFEILLSGYVINRW